MKVAIVTQGKVASGAEIITAQLYNDMKKEVTILTGSNPVINFFSDEKYRVQRINGFTPINRKNLKISTLLNLMKSLFALRKTIETLKPDYIHVYNIASLLYVAISCAKIKVPIVLHVHDFYSKDKLNKRIAKLLRKKPKKIVGVSQSICRDLIQVGFPEDRISCIHNGITVPVPLANTNNDKVNTLTIGFVATISKWKGLHILLEAAQLIDKKKYPVNYVIVGPFVDEKYKEEIISLAKGVKNNKISFLGAKKNARELMGNFDILVHCSTEADPFPTVLIEGMYQKCAVIGANGGGVPEIIHNRKTGILHTPGSGISLASAIEELINNESLRTNIAIEGFKEANKEFTIQRFRQEFFDIINNL